MVSVASAANQRLVLGSSNENSLEPSRFNLHMLSPVLLGLATPMLVITLLDPAGVWHGHLLVVGLLVSIFAVAVVLFALSLLWQGDITTVIFDTKSRRVEFVQSGLLANTSVEVHFDEVVALGVASRFDRDGYPFTQAEIQLRDGQRVALPPGTKPETLAAARKALGL
jgi:hypothetical protein